MESSSCSLVQFVHVMRSEHPGQGVGFVTPGRVDPSDGNILNAPRPSKDTRCALFVHSTCGMRGRKRERYPASDNKCEAVPRRRVAKSSRDASHIQPSGKILLRPLFFYPTITNRSFHCKEENIGKGEGRELLSVSDPTVKRISNGSFFFQRWISGF